MLYLNLEEGEGTIGGEVPLGNIGGPGGLHAGCSFALLAELNIGIRGKNPIFRGWVKTSSAGLVLLLIIINIVSSIFTSCCAFPSFLYIYYCLRLGLQTRVNFLL